MEKLANQNRSFILNLYKEHKRLDKRAFVEGRQPKIYFGKDYGSCLVILGKTKVHVQVTSKIGVPRVNRPQQGMIFINTELSPIDSNFEPGRPPEMAVTLSRQLETSIKSSDAIDLESLCILEGKKTWEIRIDVHVLNHDGGLIDAASIGVVAALAHFKRPKVTVSGNEDIVMHPIKEQEPVPLTLLHHPLCVTFGMLNTEESSIVDPTDLEEKVLDTIMVIGINSHKEVVLLEKISGSIRNTEKTMSNTKIAFERVVQLTKLIKDELKKDTDLRKQGKPPTLHDYFETRCATTETKVGFLKPNLDDDTENIIRKDGEGDIDMS